MTLRECYTALGGNFDDVLGRLSSERLVERFALKFLTDDSFDQLKTGIENQDLDLAFRGAHTLKGVCQNLSFTQLGDSSSALTEALRGDWHAGWQEKLAQVEEDYASTAQALNSYKDGK